MIKNKTYGLRHMGKRHYELSKKIYKLAKEKTYELSKKTYESPKKKTYGSPKKTYGSSKKNIWISEKNIWVIQKKTYESPKRHMDTKKHMNRRIKHMNFRKNLIYFPSEEMADCCVKCCSAVAIEFRLTSHGRATSEWLLGLTGCHPGALTDSGSILDPRKLAWRLCIRQHVQVMISAFRRSAPFMWTRAEHSFVIAQSRTIFRCLRTHPSVRRPSILSSQPLPLPCPSRCQPNPSGSGLSSRTTAPRASVAHTNPADHGTDVVGIRSSAVCGPAGPSRCYRDSRGAALPALNPTESQPSSIGWTESDSEPEDIVELETSFSNLLTVLQLPLRNSETWTPALRKRVEDLSRLLQFLVSHVYVAER